MIEQSDEFQNVQRDECAGNGPENEGLFSYTPGLISGCAWDLTVDCHLDRGDSFQHCWKREFAGTMSEMANPYCSPSRA